MKVADENGRIQYKTRNRGWRRRKNRLKKSNKIQRCLSHEISWIANEYYYPSWKDPEKIECGRCHNSNAKSFVKHMTSKRRRNVKYDLDEGICLYDPKICKRDMVYWLF